MLPLVVAILTLAQGAAAAVNVVLAVDAASNVTATLDSIDEQAETVAATGSVPIHVELVAHPEYGLVASSIEILAGDLEIADLSWSLMGRYESLEMNFVGGSVRTTSEAIAATPIATNTAEIPLDDLTLLLDGGMLTTIGTVFGHPIALDADFADGPAALGLEDVATIVTTPVANGVEVLLTIPLAQVAPVAPPFVVTLFRVEGPLVLAGTGQPPAVPASPHAVWLGALLLAGGWLAARGWHARARHGEAL